MQKDKLLACKRKVKNPVYVGLVLNSDLKKFLGSDQGLYVRFLNELGKYPSQRPTTVPLLFNLLSF